MHVIGGGRYKANGEKEEEVEGQWRGGVGALKFAHTLR